MTTREWTSLFGVAFFTLAAFTLGAYTVFAADPGTMPVAAAVSLLALAQGIMLAASWGPAIRLAEKVHGLVRLQDSQSQGVIDLRERIEMVARDFTDARRATERTGEGIAGEMRSLRDSFQDFTTRYRREAANVPPPLPPLPEPRFMAEEPAGPREQLSLLLEPIVELASNGTAHYRARVSMTNEQGADIPHANVMANADRGGLRALLDYHLLKLALPVLQRLRIRNPNMRVFLPIGMASLNEQASIQRITGLLDEWYDVATAVTFEIPHQSLATMQPAAIEGFAALARQGASMALTGVSIAGLDLPALRKLGIRFLGVDAKTMDVGYGLAPSWLEFAQYGRAMQFQIMVSDVQSPAQSVSAAKIARYASGSHYAPPRRVKAGVGGEAAWQDRAQAA